MKLIKKAGDTSVILQVFIQDSSATTGIGLSGLVFNSSGLTAYYHRQNDTTATAITLVTMTVGTFTSSGFKEIDATNMKGWYQFCPPDAALASGASSVAFHLKGVTNMAPLPIEIQLVAVDLQDTVRFGLTAMPNVASGSAGAIITSGTGTAQLSVTSGIAQSDAAKINGVATTSVTTISANVGTTQPINFTGTGASALAKSDMVDVAGSAVSTSSAQIGVNVVNAGATAWNSGAIKTTTFTAGAIDAAAIAADAIGASELAADAATEIGTAVWATTTRQLTGTQTFNVTGNITGNLSGSVGSVTGLTASNLDATVSSRASASSLATAQTDLDTLTGVDGVTLATLQANYAPSKAGDQMDLVDAPNAIAITAIQSGLATPTNITAGTITTVTNLTNAPTAGDLTATMKASVTTAATAATPTVTAGTVSDKTGYALTSPYDFAKGTTAMTESYAVNGAAPTPVQAIMSIHQYLMDFSIAGVNYTVKKLDNSTTAFIVALNDDASPTAASRT